jgi:flavin-dependent dehydrogenase
MSKYDVLIIGAGPAGSTFALLLARAGKRVLALEKSTFPRFHIGESILPRNFPLIQELGLESALRAIPHVPKFGAEFGIGDDPNTTRFTFDTGLVPGTETFNIERAVFDKMLMDNARAAGAEIRESIAVRKILKLTDGDVELELSDGQHVSAKYLLDASGHGTVVARHLGTRKNFDDPQLQKVAYFNHFKNVWRLPGTAAGHPTVIMNKEGWFWIIAINEETTSVGFVARPDFVKMINVPPNQLLNWAIERCPVVRERLKSATSPETNEILADFSYQCRPIAGEGYFLVGDAACFLDPIFSTGVTLAMMAATQASRHTLAILDNRISAAKARKQYIDFVEGSTAVFWRLIRSYYQHSFRELFMNGRGPLQVHNAIISLLAGQVFPKPCFALRWRLWFFELCVALNKHFPLVPRRPEFSLVAAAPVPRANQIQTASAA